jgi:hypothetical protein
MPTIALNGRLPCRAGQLEIKKLLGSQAEYLISDKDHARKTLYGRLQ